jgi:hypothetical protein
MVNRVTARSCLFAWLVGFAAVIQPSPCCAKPQAPGPTQDQIQRSHDLENLNPPADPDFAVQSHLQGLEQKELDKFLKNFKGSRDAAAMLKQYKEFAKQNPFLAESVRSALGFDPTKLDEMSPEQWRDAQQTLQKFKGIEGVAGRVPLISPPKQSSPSTPNPTGDTSSNPPAAAGGASGPVPPAEARQREGSGNAAPKSSEFSRKVKDIEKRLDNVDPKLKNSSALRKAIDALTGQFDGNSDPSWDKMASNMTGLRDGWLEFAQRFHLNKLVPGKGLPVPQELISRLMPNIPWQRVEDGLSREVSGNLPVGGGGAVGSAPNWQVLIGFVGLIVLCVLIGRSIAHAQHARREQREAGWRLGPWPVRPGEISTREDLVRAFEYLSLLCLGRAALTYNHRVIAEQLADPRRLTPQVAYFDDRQRAVDELAALYEQARYAPPSDLLPDTALAAARRDLCLLAGVRAA